MKKLYYRIDAFMDDEVPHLFVEYTYCALPRGYWRDLLLKVLKKLEWRLATECVFSAEVPDEYSETIWEYLRIAQGKSYIPVWLLQYFDGLTKEKAFEALSLFVRLRKTFSGRLFQRLLVALFRPSGAGGGAPYGENRPHNTGR